MVREHPKLPEFFDGNVIKHHDLAKFSIGEILYPPGYERPVHAHERACFISFSRTAMWSSKGADLGTARLPPLLPAGGT